MGVSMAVVSFAVAADGTLSQTRQVHCDTTNLAMAIEDIDNRGDEPDDVHFAWIDPLDYEQGLPFAENLDANRLWDPADILTSLAWISKLGAEGEVKMNDISFDFDQVRTLCSFAAAHGERIGVFLVT
jgi:hypothetical protein